jgi:hypothetical protein
MISGVNYKAFHAVEVASTRAWPLSGVSNKPMVPTALTQPADHPLPPLRRHIGQPLERK